MIVRMHVDEFQPGEFDYRVSHEGLDLFADAGLASLPACLLAALDGLGQDALAAEVAFKGVVSGTYPLDSIAAMAEPIADHARNTTEAIEELLRQAGGMKN